MVMSFPSGPVVKYACNTGDMARALGSIPELGKIP